MGDLSREGRIHQALLNVFVRRDLLAEFVDYQLERHYDEIETASESYRANVRLIIRRAAGEGWLPELVRKAYECHPADAALKSLAEELARITPNRQISHYDVCRLTGGYVMLDRKSLRRSVRDIHSPNGKRILLISGERYSGRSHSLQLILYLSAVACDFLYVPIDLDAFKRAHGADAILDPRQLGGWLVDMLGYDMTLPEPPEDHQWARWVWDFCKAFETCAMRDTRRPWIAIDTLDGVTLEEATVDLIKELAERMRTNLVGFRLILVGYRHSFPPRLLPLVKEDTTGPIGIPEVLAFYEAAFTELGVPYDKDRLVHAAASTFRGLDPAREDYLLQLGMRASEELRRITEEVTDDAVVR
jgi:uncharacterized protein related to proFAR isomerase